MWWGEGLGLFAVAGVTSGDDSKSKFPPKQKPKEILTCRFQANNKKKTRKEENNKHKANPSHSLALSLCCEL